MGVGVVLVVAGGFLGGQEIDRQREAERLAAESAAADAAGYASVEDYRAAQRAGFTGPEHLAEARSLGLETAEALKQWREAKVQAERLGFSDVPSFRAAVEAGFSDPARWAEAQRRGFETPAELDAALAAEAGFDDAEAWRQARELGFETEAELAAHEEAECRSDLRCWGEKHLSSAHVYCRRPIERLARGDVEWDTGLLTDRFDRFMWPQEEGYPEGAIRYIGDRAKFQNGFGAWLNVIYLCDFDPATDTVLNVEAGEGRLPE